MNKDKKGIIFAIAMLFVMIAAVVFAIVVAYSEPMPTEPSVNESDVTETTQESEVHKETRIGLFETSDIDGYIMDTTGGDKNTFEYRLAYMASIFNKARTSGDYDDVILVDGGDIYMGAPVSNLTEGAALRAAFDNMGYDAVTVGNHEFDWDFNTYSTDVSATLPAYELGSYTGDPSIPVLASTLYNTTNDRRTLMTKDYVIVEKAGYRIALIGYIPDYSSEILSSKMTEYKIHDDLGEFAAHVKEINEAEHPDATVVIGHCDPETLANALDPADVDLVCGGHTHKGLCDTASNGITYIQPEKDAQGYARATIVIDNEGNVRIEDQAYKSIMEVPEFLYDTADNAEYLDPVILDISKVAWEEISEEMNEALGYIDSDVEKKGFIDDVTTTGGNFVTGIMLEYTKGDGVVAAFYNRDGVRKDFITPEGGIYQVSVGDIYAICPFNNRLLIYELSGQELAQQLVNGLIDGNYGDQVSGLTYEYRNNGTAEEPDYEIVSIVLSNGTKVDINGEEAKYKVCVTSYSATLEGSVFEGKEPLYPELEAPVDNQAIIEYLRNRRDKGVTHIPTDNNSRAVCLDPEPVDTQAQDDQTTQDQTQDQTQDAQNQDDQTQQATA